VKHIPPQVSRSNQNMATTADDIRAFYDAFSRDRMQSYRVRPNLRIARAIDFFCSFATAEDVILDVGCGIGVATEAMAKRARKVIGIDISAQNVQYARTTVRLPNVSFYQIDIIHDRELLKASLPTSPTIVTLCDVIEHIPANDRPTFFKNVREVCSKDAALLLTFPSAFYQRFLAEEAAHELQIVDNIITPDQLCAEAAAVGFSMTYFALIDVWKRVQYAHCALECEATLSRRVRESAPPRTIFGHLRKTIADLRVIGPVAKRVYRTVVPRRH
jgi:2-polyprenyl-3-methyl-5-hydroxy-6-metoxy-1,4-benzoquinol methylase